MNFDIFNEEFYLKKYPFVQQAIDQGIVQSGLDHFQRFGLQQGLTEVSRYYDETFYLTENPGVANAVNAGLFPSGLAHFIQFGYEEGRTQISSDYDEVFYVSNNFDIQPFIENGTFQNGLEHFLKFGISDSRFSNSFLDVEYLERYPSLVPFVEQGVFRTGREHYEEFGQFENRSVTFIGGPGDDIVTSFGFGEVELIGVEVGLDANGNRIYESDGVDETDTLVGGPARDTFVIGVGRSLSDSPPGDFYANIANFSRRAIVQNYTPGQDFIQLGGQPGDYIFGTDTTSVSTIFNRSRAPLVEIQGITDFDELNIIYSGQVSLERNFLEDEYLDQNPDVAALVQAETFRSGLDHYERVGQFETNRSATFVGTSGNDIVTAFGIGSHDITGVEVSFATGRRNYLSEGSDEFDTLIGSSGAADTFILGNVILNQFSFFIGIQTFYEGVGEARIQGFSQSDQDAIQMVIGPEDSFSVFPLGNDLIIAVEGNTLAILEGSAGLTLTPTNINNNSFYQSFTLI